MPRANRYYLAGYVWHITHRCHQRKFLLKFDKDKRRWIHWLFEAKKRFGLCVLNYVVTSNHIHLLVLEKTAEAISRSMQLISGRTGQEYNIRKNRKGAFWEDRYHATAVDHKNHLIQCMLYIDLNMVRAGIVSHPKEWKFGGYQEIIKPKLRYSITDHKTLKKLLDIKNEQDLKHMYNLAVENELKKEVCIREPEWSQSIAVGSEDFILDFRNKLGFKAGKRKNDEMKNH